MEPRRNLERKSRCADLSAARVALAALGASREGVQVQTDTFFRVPHGRLKLRQTEGAPAVLIWYDRPDDTAVRLSRYHLVPVSDAATLKGALTDALGVRGEVRKRREVQHWHNVRIHLDEVTGLGTFVEFEAVLGDGEDEPTAQERLDHLGCVLSLKADDDRTVSYADLLGI
jgi:predicted adenylyl cyclase CyaB